MSLTHCHISNSTQAVLCKLVIVHVSLSLILQYFSCIIFQLYHVRTDVLIFLIFQYLCVINVNHLNSAAELFRQTEQPFCSASKALNHSSGHMSTIITRAKAMISLFVFNWYFEMHFFPFPECDKINFLNGNAPHKI